MDLFLTEGKQVASRVGSFLKNAYQRIEHKLIERTISSDWNNDKKRSLKDNKSDNGSDLEDEILDDNINIGISNGFMKHYKSNGPGIRRPLEQIECTSERIEEITFHHPVSKSGNS